MFNYLLGVVLLLFIFNLQINANDNGHLVIIGGGERAPVILNKISELAGSSNGKIVIIPAANFNPLEIALLQRYEFEKTGIGKVDFVLLGKDGSADADSTRKFVSIRSNNIFTVEGF